MTSLCLEGAFFLLCLSTSLSESQLLLSTVLFTCLNAKDKQATFHVLPVNC